MRRKILGVAAGLVVGIGVIAGVEAVPAGIPAGTALAWLLGTAAGTWTAQKIARDPSEKWPAVTVEAFLLAAGVFNLLAFPHPAWFWIAGLAAFPVGTFAGIRLARGA